MLLGPVSWVVVGLAVIVDLIVCVVGYQYMSDDKTESESKPTFVGVSGVFVDLVDGLRAGVDVWLWLSPHWPPMHVMMYV